MSGHPLESLSALLDGELTGDARRDVETHLAGCPSCARHMRELTEVDTLARGLAPVAAPEGYEDVLPARVRARIRADRAPVARVPWLWPLAAGFALAVLAPIVLQKGRPTEDAARGATSEVAPSDTVPSAIAPPNPAGLAQAPAAPPQSQAYATAPAEKPRDEAAPERETARLQDQSAVGTARPEAKARQDRRAAATAGSAIEPPASVAAAAPPAGALAGAASRAPIARETRNEDTRTREARTEAAEDATAIQDQPGPETSTFARPPASGAAAAMGKAETDGAARRRGEDQAFRAAAAVPLSSTGDARRARQEWRRFLAGHPRSARADEARVRVVEASVAAFRASADPADRMDAERDAAAYLSSTDAPQAERVRAALRRLDEPR